MKLSIMVLAAFFVVAPMHSFAHEKHDATKKVMAVKKEQKQWGIAGDTKKREAHDCTFNVGRHEIYTE